MAMRPGDLDRRIQLQRYGQTVDADNQPAIGYSPIATVWASVTPVSDGERVRASEVGATISMRFQVWYSSTVADLNPKDRVIYNGKNFDIVGVKELGRREGLEISAAAPADE